MNVTNNCDEFGLYKPDHGYDSSNENEDVQMDSTYGSMGRKTSGWIALLVLWVERFIDKREGENYLRELLAKSNRKREKC